MITRTLFLTFTLLLTQFSLASETAAPAPDFTAKTREGSNLRLEEQKGNVVMLNFWASWCGPCRKEMPLLEDLSKKYERMGFKMIGVNVDEDSGAAERFLKDTPISFTTVLDPEGKVSKLFDVKAMPTSIMIDRSGNVRNVHPGYREGDEKQYEKVIKTLIRE